MSISKSYRLNKPTLCVNSTEDGHYTSILIPAGATVTIADGPLNSLPMVNAIWEAKAVMLFAVDLQERATLVKRRSASAA
jgi:hypothetical protein